MRTRGPRVLEQGGADYPVNPTWSCPRKEWELLELLWSLGSAFGGPGPVTSTPVPSQGSSEPGCPPGEGIGCWRWREERGPGDGDGH